MEQGGPAVHVEACWVIILIVSVVEIVFVDFVPRYFVPLSFIYSGNISDLISRENVSTIVCIRKLLFHCFFKQKSKLFDPN